MVSPSTSMPQSPSTAPAQAIPLSRQLLAAARALEAVLQGQSLSDALERTPAPWRPGAQALAFHALRHLGHARALRRLLVPRDPPHRRIEALLLLGLSLMEPCLRAQTGWSPPAGTPLYHPHTLVHQMVEAAVGDARTRPAKNLINAVLRRYGREHIAWRERLQSDPEACWNHPSWWIQTVQQAWPDDWQRLLRAANDIPPMTLRANRRRISRAALHALLSEAGMAATPVLEDGLILASAAPVDRIPGYREGLWSVQDASAQRAAMLLPLTPGARVLDACAAPGGKTAHLLERCDLSLTALDQNAQRLEKITDNLHRLGLQSAQVRLQQADARQPALWWDGQPYDAIVADVPCTASGVVRRHPDIRWLRRAQDLEQTVALQAQILNALWPVLAPGGHLLYVTCSIFPQEGEAQIQAFLRAHPLAIRLPAPGHVLPGNAEQGDGFYYALLQKPSACA